FLLRHSGAIAGSIDKRTRSQLQDCKCKRRRRLEERAPRMARVNPAFAAVQKIWMPGSALRAARNDQSLMLLGVRMHGPIKILITGANGQVGHELLRALRG